MSAVRLLTLAKCVVRLRVDVGEVLLRIAQLDVVGAVPRRRHVADRWFAGAGYQSGLLLADGLSAVTVPTYCTGCSGPSAT